jgi:hypothetical protein
LTGFLHLDSGTFAHPTAALNKMMTAIVTTKPLHRHLETEMLLESNMNSSRNRWMSTNHLGGLIKDTWLDWAPSLYYLDVGQLTVL